MQYNVVPILVVQPQFTYTRKIHDGRAVHAHEKRRVETLLETCKRLAHHVHLLTHVKLGEIVSGLDPVDVFNGLEENRPAMLDYNPRSPCTGRSRTLFCEKGMEPILQ